MIPNLRPIDLLAGREADAAVENGTAVRLAGGWIAFSAIEVAGGGDQPISITDLAHARSDADDDAPLRDQMARLTAERPAVAGLDLTQPRIMGIVNVTPDSFSDGGRFLDPAAAIAHGRALRRDGADILDIGGESTRPGAAPVSPDEECARILPVIEALVGDGAVVSVDTRHARTIEAAAKAGAALINDVWALTGDPDGDALAAAAATGLPVVLMHMRGTPQTMQRNPRYDDVAREVCDWLAARIALAGQAGISRERIIVDPGIGFGKTLAHNLALLSQLALFHALGAAILVGASRKSFIAKASQGEPADRRLAGSLAAALAAAARGAHILRVHDVAETVQALTLHCAIEGAAS